MSEETVDQTTETVEPEAGETAEVSPTPPWGSDEEFNPERAWNLIQNLRAERDGVKEKHGDVAARLQEFEDAKLSAEEKTARDLEQSQAQLNAIMAENALLKAGVEHGLSAGDLELLDGLPADVIADRAAALAERLAASEPKRAVMSDRPKPALRGGATPGVEPERTPEQIVAEIYGGK